MIDFSPYIVDVTVKAFRSLETDEYIIKQKRVMPPDHFQHNFGTVQIKLQRSAGHTLAALKLLLLFPNSKLLIPHDVLKRHTINYAASHFGEQMIDYMRKRLLAPHQLERFVCTQVDKLDMFIVDPYSAFENDQRLELDWYDELACIQYHSKMIVKLG